MLPYPEKLMVVVYITDNETEFLTLRKIIESKADTQELTIVYCQSDDELIAKVKDAEIVLCFTFTEEMLAKAGGLKWIHFGTAGVDHTLFPALLESNIIITNSKGINSHVMSEFVMGMMLHFSNLFDQAFRRFYLDREWWDWRVSTSSFLLEGKTIGIVGLGKVGTAIAQKAKAFGVRVIATRRHPGINRIDCVDLVLRYVELETLLRQSDFVVLTVPYTKETYHLIGETELARMKKTAYLINVARGEIVDESALISALKKRKIAGAGLDVFETEPLPSDSELFELDNVLITPHIAGIFNDFVNSVAEGFADNLQRYINNEPLHNVVNKRLGY